jgi:hypothetical protein
MPIKPQPHRRCNVKPVDILTGIGRGLADIAAGRTQPLDEAFDDIRRTVKSCDGISGNKSPETVLSRRH